MATVKKQGKNWLLGLVIVLTIGGYFTARDLQYTHRIKTTQNSKQVEYQGQNGKNVFDLLKNEHSVEFSNSDLGVFVTSIDNLQNTSTDYWIWYANDKMGTVAADQYQTHNDQKITWKYQTIQY